MVSLEVLKSLVFLCREARVPLLIYGEHGQGKSSIVRLAARELGISLVDFRLSTCEAADLRGLPDKSADGNSTRFLPPDELPKDGEGILFLDEINRVPDTSVLNAAMNLILDRQLGTYRLPDGYSIVAAGNFEGGDYHVTELDPAFRSRFCQVAIKSGKKNFEEWRKWCSATYPGIGDQVIEFCESNLGYFSVQRKQENPIAEITPNPRAWELAIRLLSAAERMELGKNVTLEALSGVLGRTIATSFCASMPDFRPVEYLAKGFEKSLPILKNLNRNQLLSLAWGLATLSSLKTDEPETMKKLVDLLEYLSQHHQEIALAFCTEMVREMETERNGLNPVRRMVLLRNPQLAKTFLKLAEKAGENQPFLEELHRRGSLADLIASISTTEAAEG